MTMNNSGQRRSSRCRTRHVSFYYFYFRFSTIHSTLRGQREGGDDDGYSALVLGLSGVGPLGDLWHGIAGQNTREVYHGNAERIFSQFRGGK